MKNKTGWIVAGILAVVLFLGVPGMFILSRLTRFNGMMAGRGMWERGGERFSHPGFMNPGMMNSRPFGFLVPALACLMGLVLLGLLIWGVVAFIRRSAQPHHAVVAAAPAAPVRAVNCLNCGKSTQADWKNCPYCGNKLISE